MTITEQQREERKNYIGGSDMSIILGLSSYKTPYQLYLEKKGLIVNNIEESNVQYWGNRLESILRDEFEKRNKIKVEVKDVTYTHPLYPFIKANLDGFIPELNSVWEGKTSGQFMAKYWGDEYTDMMPMEYIVQVASYCSILNCEGAHISVLIGGNDYREFRYTRDHDLENKIIEAGCQFWECLQNDTPPPPVNLKDLRLMYPESISEKSKIIDPSTYKILNSLIDIKEKIKDLEIKEEQDKFLIQKYMEAAEYLVDENQELLCTWKTNKKGSRNFLIK